jgi:hypothetical protein
MTPLKPCPFCPSPPVRTWDHDARVYSAGCFNTDCPVRPMAYGLTQAEADAAWNTRAAEKPK